MVLRSMIGASIASPRSVLPERDALEHVHQPVGRAAGTPRRPRRARPCPRSTDPGSRPRCRWSATPPWPAGADRSRGRHGVVAIFSAVTPAGSRTTAWVPRPSTRAGVMNWSGDRLSGSCGDLPGSAAPPAPSRSWSHRSSTSHSVSAGRDQPARRLSRRLPSRQAASTSRNGSGHREQCPTRTRPPRSPNPISAKNPSHTPVNDPLPVELGEYARSRTPATAHRPPRQQRP